ncbi:AraC family transcriptional regulator [Peptoniphilus mikwangii]|uniref:AraC family transcriptional regulator n=1 Tax=Peptoniphilus mikwangii TaxID=1354300 RepID=UPI0004282E0F|nr:AraC family transcriptional regulator [Peptoniphilus mikwangii]
MNIIESFNRTINYIESVLDDELNEKEIVHLSGYSFSMFSRIFSILTGTTLTEYIRSRKLTQAAIELRETKCKVIDIAVKYGYESTDSFGNAFKKFHGYTPTEVRRGKPFRIVSRVQLALSIRGGKAMNIRIQKKPAFKVAGKSIRNIESALCPKAWEELYSKYSHEVLSEFGSGQSFGMCFDVDNINNINYMACYDVVDVNKAKEMGLEVFEIEEGDYAVVNLKGKVPDCIHEGWKYLMEVFFPEHGYMHSGKPDFEVYSEGDMDSENYEMELWVPVVKDNK